MERVRFCRVRVELTSGNVNWGAGAGRDGVEWGRPRFADNRISRGGAPTGLREGFTQGQ